MKVKVKTEERVRVTGTGIKGKENLVRRTGAIRENCETIRRHWQWPGQREGKYMHASLKRCMVFVARLRSALGLCKIRA